MSDMVRYDLLLYVDPKKSIEKSRKEIEDAMLGVAQAVPGFIESETDVLSKHWYAYAADGSTTKLELDRPVVRFSIEAEPTSPSWIDRLHDALQNVATLHIRTARDIAVGALGHWSPSSVDGWHFGTTKRVLEAIGIREVWEQGWKGQGVNVVIVDRGLDQRLLPPGTKFGTTLARPDPTRDPEPTDPAPDASAETLAHGTMVARAVLAVAPKATIWDLRTVAKPADTVATIGLVDGAYNAAPLHVRLRPHPPTVFVNPWGVFDSRFDPGLAYVKDARHFFHHTMKRIVDTWWGAGRIHDVVFAAGNGGQFAPTWRQGRGDRGPNLSILGANGHPSVLSVGAVRSDGIWLGYSSQGRSRLLPWSSTGELPGHEKPDLCAPSNFVLREDRSWFCSGTSAASAVAAGVVAVLRSWELTQTKYPRRSPSRLIEILRQTAKRPQGTSWSDRTGMGIINAACALEMLMRADPDT